MLETLQGKGTVSGIAIGSVTRLVDDYGPYLKSYISKGNEAEQQKVLDAQNAVGQRLNLSIKDHRDNGRADQAAIMEAHSLMLQDPMLHQEISQQIAGGDSAPQACLTASLSVAAILEGLDDPYLQERASDVLDIGKQLAAHILNIKGPEYNGIPMILCSWDIEPSIIANTPSAHIQGLILGKGSTTSHTIIMAKANGIPTITGVGDHVSSLADGLPIVLDAVSGKIIPNPDTETVNQYTREKEQIHKKSLYYQSILHHKPVTKDGKAIKLAANIGLPKDMANAIEKGCQGIGLYRTEFVFMGKNTLPTEEEQFQAYSSVVSQCKDELCIIRTMDIGGDKPMPALNIPPEDNPFLGWRALRISLARPELFQTQLKAILRAASNGKVGIMLPMVTGVEELLQAKQAIRQAAQTLKEHNIPHSTDIQVGIMVETPAAALMAPELAEECDFFSIGTNDLTQYTLAADRGNEAVSNLYDPMHPAVLRLIHAVAQAAHQKGKWVGMCGELAGNPKATRLLLSLGLDELSMSPPSLGPVKHQVLHATCDPELAQKALACKTGAEVKHLLETQPRLETLN